MLYQVRDQDGMYPTSDSFETVNSAANYVRDSLYHEVAYCIVNRLSDAVVAIVYDHVVFVPRHKDHWTQE
jgi:hypothetical protein